MSDPFGPTRAQRIYDHIDQAILNQPRSLQAHLGPSEIGNPCDRCLTRKLAGITPANPAVSWYPWVGTAVHAQLAQAFFGARGYIVEQRVKVGTIAGYGEVTGTMDVYDRVGEGPVDWKFVGPSTLKKVHVSGPSQQYRVQLHAYARGAQRDLGLPVKTVAICYLPRQLRWLGGSLASWRDEAFFWEEPYDESVALVALHRCERLLDAYKAWDYDGGRGQFLASLPTDPDCWDCRDYERAA